MTRAIRRAEAANGKDATTFLFPRSGQCLPARRDRAAGSSPPGTERRKEVVT